MRILVVIAVLVSVIATPALTEETDDAAFKERVAACKTERCLIEVAQLYLTLWQIGRDLGGYPPDETAKKRYDAYLARVRAQLHDPDIYPMMEDGRWDAMTEEQKHDWTETHWGPYP